MYSSFVYPILHIILHGLMFVFLFLFLILHGVCIIGIMGYIIGGGSYSSVYVPPPLYVFPVVLMVCIPTFFSFSSPSFMFCVPISRFTYAPGFSFAHLCEFYPCLDENFWGVYAYAFYHMQLYVCFEICILNILYYI